MLFIDSHREIFALALVLAASLVAAIFDIRTRRIPNALVLLLFVSGFAASLLAGPFVAALDVVITGAVLLLGTVAFSLKLIGGGDVKLLAVAAGTLGFPAAVIFVLSTFICGGIIAIAYSALRGQLRATFGNLRGIALPLFAGVTPARLHTGTAMPYALAIFAGALVTVIANGHVPELRF